MSLTTQGRIPSVSDKQQFRLLCAATLPFFLVAALAARAWRTGRPAPRSVLAEARAAGANALLFAFQG